MMAMKETIAIIGEGITEKFFIESIKDSIKIKPKYFEPSNSSMKEYKQKVIEAIGKEYSKIICLIDMDNKIDDGNPYHLANRDEYLNFRNWANIRNKSKKRKAEIIILETYPCSELFFYYYFEYKTAGKTNEGLKRELYLKFGYEPTLKYLGKHSLHDVMEAYGGSLNDAIQRDRQSVRDRNYRNIKSCYSEMSILFDILTLK